MTTDSPADPPTTLPPAPELPEEPLSLAGKSLLVTGGSRGIGRGIAVECARAGAFVAINYGSNQADAEAALAAVREAGSDGIILQGDVREAEVCEGLVAETVAAAGRLDLFVANAYVSERERFLDADLGGVRKTVDVCMWGSFYGMRAAGRQMRRQYEEAVATGVDERTITAGAMVLVSSPHATIPIPGAMAYNMAKAAIDHMGRTAAIELARHRIRVNVLHPGWIDTPGERAYFTEEQMAAGAETLPWRRLGTSEEVGRAARYMLSQDADYMTGGTLLLDGGVSLPWWSKRDEGKQ